jgi:hypothetical protein
MFNLVPVRLGGCFLAATLALAPLASQAAVVDFSLRQFDRAALAQAQAARSDSLAGYKLKSLTAETFENQKAWDGKSGTSNPQNTRVGSFSAITDMGPGNGHSAINGGTGVEVRSDNAMAWGRYNADGSAGLIAGNWIDSNDNHGMRWDVDTGSKFNALSFFLIDAADVGGKFSMKIGDTLYSTILGANGRLANGNIQLVTILLDKAVSSLTVEMFHDRTNDGFGIDGATAMQLAPVPVPPAAALILSGLSALGFVRRRRRAA